MKTTSMRFGAAFAAVMISVSGFQAIGQVAETTSTTTTTTTTSGTIAEMAPGSETVVVTSRENPRPIRYTVTKETRFVNEAGAPVEVTTATRGTPVTVHTSRAGDRVVAQRVVVHKTETTKRISKAEAKALREYYDELEDSLENEAQKAQAKAQKEYYEELEEQLDD